MTEPRVKHKFPLQDNNFIQFYSLIIGNKIADGVLL